MAQAEEDYSDSADEWDAPINLQPEDTAVRNSKFNPSNDEERELAGDPVPITFQMPDGTTLQHSFFMGHTIEFVKAWLEEEAKVKYEQTTLFLGDRQLFDPLSLNDLPFKAHAENTVRVVVS